MSTNRLSSAFLRIAAVLLVGLLLAQSGLAGGLQISIKWGKGVDREKPSSKVAKALAEQTAGVEKKFERDRGALRPLRGTHGESLFALADVAGLVDRTARDLDQTLTALGEPRLEALRAWKTEELRPVQDELTKPARHAAAALPFGLSSPRAMVASLGGLALSLPRLVSAKVAPPKPATIPTGRADQLLDQVGKVVSQIFFLAAHDDLEVTLWVGSEPAKGATFRFSPHGKIAGSASDPAIIRTNGNRAHVWRGSYDYSVAWTRGSVTEWIKYPNPAGAPAAQQSERLDLVQGSSYFCCRFDEQYCHHVASEKECRR